MKGPAALITLVLLFASCKSGRPLPLLHRDLPARSGDRIIERMLVGALDAEYTRDFRADGLEARFAFPVEKLSPSPKATEEPAGEAF